MAAITAGGSRVLDLVWMMIIEAKAQHPSTPRITPDHHVYPPGLLNRKKPAREFSGAASSTTITLVGSADPRGSSGGCVICAALHYRASPIQR
jgi:hypothetical protein